MRHAYSSAQPLRSLITHGKIAFGGDVLCTGATSELSRVGAGDLFAAATNHEHDSHELAERAVQRGAVAIMCERMLPLSVPQVIVPDARFALGVACQRLAGNPSREIPVIGVTGTLGKTTTALLTASVLNHEKQGVAALTSLAHCDAVQAIPALQTTPPAEELARLLRASVQHGCSHAVVEFSSAGLIEHRGAGVELEIAVLTNLRRAHIDRHNTLANYRAAKQRLFSLLKPAGAIVLNVDDPFSQSLLGKLSRPVLTVGLHQPADVTATLLERHAYEQTFLLEAGSDSLPITTRMIGDQHIHNCLTATAVGLLSGLELPTIAAGLQAVESIPGRMERVECGQEFSVFVDDARTHNGLAMCLKTVRQVTRGRVICVLSPDTQGDAEEAPLLGKVLEKGAQIRVITSAGPAADDSLEQAHNVLDGFEHPARARLIPSRDQALAWALEEAQPGDAVVICGQGHAEWSGRGETTTDSAFAREKLYEIVARELRHKPLVFAYSG